MNHILIIIIIISIFKITYPFSTALSTHQTYHKSYQLTSSTSAGYARSKEFVTPYCATDCILLYRTSSAFFLRL